MRNRLIVAAVAIIVAAALTPYAALRHAAAAPGITFSHEVTVDPQRADGEPDVAISTDGQTMYSGAPYGFSTTVSLAWKSANGGVRWTNLHGSCPTNPLRPDCSRGGGDAEFELGTPATMGNPQRAIFQDLNGLDTVSCSYSDDGGDTFHDLSAGNVAGQACNVDLTGSVMNPNNTSIPGTDRQWVTVCPVGAACDGTNTTDTDYMVFDTGDTPPNGDAAMISTDGGATWSSQCTSTTTLGGLLAGNLETCVGGPNGFGTRPGPVIINTKTGTLYEFLGTNNSSTGQVDGTEVNISCDGGKDWASVQVGPMTGHADNNDTNDFVTGAIDSAGGLYMVWAKDNGSLNGSANPNEPWQVFYSHSTDPNGTLLTTMNTTSAEMAATPGNCGTNKQQGGTWSAPVPINGPSGLGNSNVNFGVMPWITAGDPGRVDIVYYGTSHGLPYDPANQASDWFLRMAQSTNGQAATPAFTDVQATEQPMHRLSICFSGISCSTQSPPGGDRNLLDFYEVKTDPLTGRAVIIFTDDNNTAQCASTCNPGAGIISSVQQATGPSLFNSPAQGSAANVGAFSNLLSQSTDVRTMGVNAEYANAGSTATLAAPLHNLNGAPVPAADITDFKVQQKDPQTLEFLLTMKNLSGGPASAVIAPHTGATWLVTWHWNNDLWFAQATSDAAGNVAYTAGRPLSIYNDGEPKALEYTTALNSNATGVTGSVNNAANTIEIDVPVSAVGNIGTSGDPTDHTLRGLTAFTGDADAPISTGSTIVPQNFSGVLAFFTNIDQSAPLDVNIGSGFVSAAAAHVPVPNTGGTPEPRTGLFVVVLSAVGLGLLAVFRRRRGRPPLA